MKVQYLRMFASAIGAICLLAGSPGTTAQLKPNDVLSVQKIKPVGTWEKISVPDTLDLAERASLSVNYMINNTIPDKGRSLYHIVQFDTDPPGLYQLTWNLPIKELRALPWVRTMSGNSDGLDVEADIMRAYLKQIGDDGVVYYPYGGEGVPEGTSYAFTQGMVGIAIANWYQRDRNPKWLDYIQAVCNGIGKMAIRVEDRAYFPLESGFQGDGKWHWTTREAAAQQFMPYNPPDEPVAEQQGYEGIAKYDQSAALRTLIINGRFKSDAASKELADKLVRFMMKPGLWADTGRLGYPGNEHGIWEGHFHGNLVPMHALLDYAIFTKNNKLKQAMREAYDQAVRNSVIRLGWSPFWIPPGGFNRPHYISGWCDTCNISDTIMFAVKLTDAGLGDYWDDVDSCVRNQLVEQQFTDLEKMREMAGVGDKNDKVLKMVLGGFGGAEPTVAKPLTYGCCSANGPVGLYYAWHGITRFDNGVATVNLFLNRVSQWMDVLSWLPYEGKVVLKNKQAHTAEVRIPKWLDVDEVKSWVNDQPAKPSVSGRHLVFTGLKKGDTIRLEFPVPETQDKYTIYGNTYTVTFRGSTVVDITPRDVTSASQGPESYKKMYPIYQRDNMKGTKAAMVTKKMFVPDRVLPLQ